MKEFFKDILSDKTIVFIYLINGFFIVATIISILLFYGSLPPFIPIFNQLPWGEQRLGTTLAIFIPVLVALLIFITNVLTSAIAYEKIPLVSRMLAATSLLASVLTWLLIVKTIILII